MQNNTILWNAINGIETHAVACIDTKGHIQRINKGFTGILGFNEEEVYGRSIGFIIPENIKNLYHSLLKDHRLSKGISFERFFLEMISLKENKTLAFSAICKDKTKAPITLTISEVQLTPNKTDGFIAIISNNAKQLSLQGQLKHYATHDQLTGLISWQAFSNEVQKIESDAKKKNDNYHASLLFCDIDYFKTLSYHSQKEGDDALKKFAAWFIEQTRHNENRSKDIIGTRFFSDEFVIYLPNTHIDQAVKLASRLKSDFKKINFRGKENPFFTSISAFEKA